MRTRSMLAIEVRAQRFEQPAEQRGAHDVEMACDRIEHLDRVASASSARSVAELTKLKVMHFLVVAVDQPLAQAESERVASRAGSIAVAVLTRSASGCCRSRRAAPLPR